MRDDVAVEEVTEAELINAFIDSRETEMMTAFPAKVESYNNSKQTVDVVPALYKHLPDGQGNYVPEQLPKVSSVPVCFPRVGGFFMSFPIQAGDYVLVICCQKNIGEWRSTGNAGDPGDVGMHTLDGAVAIPGVFPDSKALSNADGTNMVLGSDSNGGGRIELKSSGINLGASATDGVVTKRDLQALHNAISTAAVASDGSGATFKANILINLVSAGWTPLAGDGTLASTTVKALR